MSRSRPTRARPLPTLVAALAAGAISAGSAPLSAQSLPIFEELAAELGLDFVHFNGMSGELYLLENVGSGSALFDYDGDGDLDVYLVQGEMLGRGKTVSDATFSPPPGSPLSDRLFRNDLASGPDGRAVVRFVDVSERAGIVESGYGMGVAAADWNADGAADLYVTNYGPNQLLRNAGDGTFEDVTAASGTDDVRWSVAAVFFDFDGDGLLDLWVGNYLVFDTDLDHRCSSQSGIPDYCGPLSYSPQRDSLFRNRGDGTFEDWSQRSGILSEFGGALGGTASDFDGDGRTDLYVANDMTANQLWINQGDGTFRNDALFAGVAVNWEGKAEASMGVDAGDFDDDGDDDLFMAHLVGETNTLYVNDGSGLFRDETHSSELGNPSWNATGFGTAWFDYDNDGWLDLLVVNGAVSIIESLALAGDPYPLHQPNQLFRNLGDGRFEVVSGRAGPAFELSEVSRGASFGDLDNDGDTDALVTQNAGPARLLINREGDGSGWIGVRAAGAAGPTSDRLGTRVVATPDGGRPRHRRSRADGSFASANDARILAGLGAPGSRVELLVTDPGGAKRRFRDLPAERYFVVPPGRGR